MLNHEFPPLGGGASNATYHLSRELVKLGVDVDLVTMGYKELPKIENVDGVKVYRIPCMRRDIDSSHINELLTFDLRALRFLLKLTKNNKYNLNHTHFIIPEGFISLILKKIKGIPYILTAHGSDVPDYNPDKFSIGHLLINPAWKKIVQNAETVIPNSNSLNHLMQKKTKIKNIQVIPTGFDTNLFKNGKKGKKILLASRLVERKGFQYFLEAISGLDLDYEINIVGDGPYKRKLIEKAKSLNVGINFLGWLDNKSQKYKELYETSSIFVFPSISENFPLVLLEAMAAKMAIITTNTTGCPEVVGDAALFVRPRNSEDIREALTKLVNDESLRKKLGSEARKRLEDKFDLEKIAKKYLQVYNEYCVI
jgi:glycosyltransferase involved in cell wall biosynthesis